MNKANEESGWQHCSKYFMGGAPSIGSHITEANIFVLFMVKPIG
jgi:hypothetical protein